jgi:hypothetical protein
MFDTLSKLINNESPIFIICMQVSIELIYNSFKINNSSSIFLAISYFIVSNKKSFYKSICIKFLNKILFLSKIIYFILYKFYLNLCL